MLEIQVLTWDMYKNVAGLNQVVGSQPSPLGDWISNSNTYIHFVYKQRIEKPAHILFYSKRSYAFILCIVNKESRGQTLYPGHNMDSECTYLQQFCKKVKWDLQLYKDKTSEVRMSMAMVFNAIFF